jgi:predicted nucleic acid-binding protein
MRAFIDASVLFAACYSSTGASREIIRLAIRGKLALVLSDVVLEEVSRNLSAKAPQLTDVLHQLLADFPYETITASVQRVRAASTYTALKDAPIVAAAQAARVDYLVTLDRRHFIDVPGVAQQSVLRIILPSELLEVIKRQA